MKKNVFALSIAAALAGLAGTASAQQAFLAPEADGATAFAINDGAIGHILLAPYYTVQGPRNTLLNVINTDTVNGKAVKVRFRGARNSDDVFDFYVFLSPGDVWRARVYRGGEGFDQTYVELPDTSCTLPNRDIIQATPFKTGRVWGGLQTEVREGYVEFLNTADIVPGTELFRTIKHHSISGNVACDDVAIEKNIQQYLSDDAEALAARGLAFPTWGLTGHWAITDVNAWSTNSGNLTALLAVNDDNQPALGNVVVAPQNADRAPAGWSTDGTADPLLRNRTYTPLNFDFPDLSTPYLTSTVTPIQQANDLSTGLAVSEVINEFQTQPEVNFQTDWLLSLPTRRYAVAVDYGEDNKGKGSIVFNSGEPSKFFTSKNASLRNAGGLPHVYVEIGTQFFDDNERTLTAAVSPAGTPGLRGEVNVVTFNAEPADSVLGALISTQRIDPKLNDGTRIDSGWGRIVLTNYSENANGEAEVGGLPVIGYAAVTAGNGTPLGFTWPHAYKQAPVQASVPVTAAVR